MTRVYRVASIDKHTGFGVSVLQRLCKTSVKKNLYYEIKEKVIEEAFNGVRVDRKKARVKVYGLDSTKETRARLIEILHERVQYHKDKFISPVLHHELETLEVDSKGKTQAIYPNHDDQIFSYLMAMYVWYDGKNLAENFGITKNVLRTDEDIEEMDNEIDREDTKEKIKLEEVDVDVEILETEEAKMQKKFLDDAKRITSRKEYDQRTYDEEQEMFNIFLDMHKDAKRAYEEKYHIQSAENSLESHFVNLPDNLFGNVSFDSDLDFEEEEQKRKNGNLFDIFSQV